MKTKPHIFGHHFVRKVTSAVLSLMLMLSLFSVGVSTNAAETGKVKAGSVLIPTPQERDGYLFKGYYYDENTDDSPVDFENDNITQDTVYYAHYIKLGELEKDSSDKNDIAKYYDFDMSGIQIRQEMFDWNTKEEKGPGLRFVASISTQTLEQLDSLSDLKVLSEDGYHNDVEYGFVVTKSKNIRNWLNFAGDKVSNYKIKYKGTDVNGVNTTLQNTKDYQGFVTNVDCTSDDYSDRQIKDHKKFDDYRLFTVVINYEEPEQYMEDIVARPYVRYYDANNVLRTQYTDYKGTEYYGGLSTSLNNVDQMIAEPIEFTFKYKYYSRDWLADDDDDSFESGSLVIGNDTVPDRTRTIKKNLMYSQLTNGRPSKRTLIQNAPAIDDYHKNCEWIVDSSHVTYDGNTVTMIAKHTTKKFNVNFYIGETLFETINNIPLNHSVMKNDNYITAPATNNGKNFAYWLIKNADTGREVSKSYSKVFNMRVTANLNVFAYYGEPANTITISDPMFSREVDDSSGTVSDKLYVDFILAYMEPNCKLFNASEAASEGVGTLTGYTSGLVIEYDTAINLTKEDELGHVLTDEEKLEYPANDTVNKETVISYIKGQNPSIPSTRKIVVLNITNNSNYNNRNRISKSINFDNTEKARHCIFRAYYYVKDAGGNIQLTEPVYFYLYDLGNSYIDAEGIEED